jgi:hypothetical protein
MKSTWTVTHNHFTASSERMNFANNTTQQKTMNKRNILYEGFDILTVVAMNSSYLV